MKLFSAIIFSLSIFSNCKESKYKHLRMVFSETFNQSSSLQLSQNQMLIIDTTFSMDGKVEDVSKTVFLYDGNTLLKMNGKTDSIFFSDNPNVTVINNLSEYYFKSDSIPNYLNRIEFSKGIYEVKDLTNYGIFLFRDSTGIPFLGVYKKATNKLSKVKVNDYLDYHPEMFLYDFDNDRKPEVLLFTKSYLQNHYLIELNIYKI